MLNSNNEHLDTVTDKDWFVHTHSFRTSIYGVRISALTARYRDKVKRCNKKPDRKQFHLSFYEWLKIFKVNKCHYSGVKLTFETTSMERIDPRNPYTISNTVCISKKLNSEKGADFDLLALALPEPVFIKHCLFLLELEQSLSCVDIDNSYPELKKVSNKIVFAKHYLISKGVTVDV